MSATSSIEWTEKTWNPVRGCSIVSPGCVNCYAMKQAHRFSGGPYKGLTKQTTAGPQWTGKVATVESALREPLSWQKPQRVFVNSMSDLFHEDVPDAFIDQVFAVMALAERHTFQVLTKRPQRMRAYLDGDVEDLITRWADASITIAPLRDGSTDEAADRYESVAAVDWPLPNVWLGVSVENQRFADERIPLLLQTPAAVRFISAEPLLGPLELVGPLTGHDDGECPWSDPGCLSGEGDCHDACESQPRLDWVIVGGESGPSCRPCALEWIEAVIAQCKSAGVPVFVKQLGAYVVSEQRTMPVGDMFSPAKLKLEDFATQRRDEVWAWRAGLNDRKGGDIDEWPADLRVREFPRSQA